MPQLQPPQLTVESISGVLDELHAEPDRQCDVPATPEAALAESAGDPALRRPCPRAAAAAAGRALRGLLCWFRDTDRWLRVVLAFRRLARAVRALQRFARRLCCRHQLLREAVLAAWRLTEERKLVAGCERLLGNRRLTPQQKQFALAETDQISAPTPERVKRATVHLLWRERAKKYRQAWRTYTAEQHTQRYSPPGRRAQSILHAPPAPPRFDFSPRDFPLAVLEREATLTQLVDLDPKLGDVDAIVTDHRRRHPQRSWGPTGRLSLSPAHEKRNSVNVARQCTPRLGTPEPRKAVRRAAGEMSSEAHTAAQGGWGSGSGELSSWLSTTDPGSHWVVLPLSCPADCNVLDPDAEEAKGPPAQSPHRLAAEEHSPTLPVLNARPSFFGGCRASPKPKSARQTNLPNASWRTSFSPLKAAPLASAPPNTTLPHPFLTPSTAKPGRPLSSLARPATPWLP